ncbi:MAG: metal-dependent transcriptional regulator [Eubacteriales bacterium]|nr:metal-dependent transcriptional regulator [Eubacteriales bacterium]MDD4541187.1 metal-dependent transcriptional regulator [Eubacteriales bacterium]
MAVPESLENYLENIFILSRHQSIVKSVDLARAMEFSKPSVSRAVHILEDEGYITIGDHGNLSLTKSGHEIASRVYERHLFLTEFFKALGVNPQTAEQDACQIEHAISSETFNLMKEHISQFVKNVSGEDNPLKLTAEDLGQIEDKVNAPPAAEDHE